MNRRPLSMRRIVRAASLVGMVAVLAPALVSAAPETATPDRLSVDVVATNRGPLPACSGPDCTPTSFVGHFVYVDNKNQLTNLGGRTRENVPRHVERHARRPRGELEGDPYDRLAPNRGE